MGSPCTATAPQYAAAYSNHLGVAKLLWLSCRWYENVMPMQPVMKYVARKQANAFQLNVIGAKRQPACTTSMNAA